MPASRLKRQPADSRARPRRHRERAADPGATGGGDGEGRTAHARDTLHANVYARMKQALMRGRFRPGEKITIRAVPRSRIVARRALYSSCSRTVMVMASPADKPAIRTRTPGPAHCGTGFGTATFHVLSRNRNFDSSIPIIAL